MNFDRHILKSVTAAEQLAGVVKDYEAIVLSNIELIATRYERRQDYHWVDTKLNLITGEDFADNDVLRGPETIYGWIQGRGLEALAGHLFWLKSCKANEQSGLISRLEKILKEVLGQIISTREKNNGHLFFFMTTDGKAFLLDSSNNRNFKEFNENSPYNFSDLFGSKGLYAAGQYLKDKKIIAEAKQYILDISKALFNGTFESDQQQLDPKNEVQVRPDKSPQGPFMIQIGSAALLAQYERDADSVEVGLRLIRHIMNNHINLKNRWADLQEFDFVEFIDADGKPYLSDGRVFSDIGHSLEFVGLALKFIQVVKRGGFATSGQQTELVEMESILPDVLRHNFNIGFQPGPSGILKTFDLLKRRVINTDMPWWSLPETIRAALECSVAVENKQFCFDILANCHNAFVCHYVKPELNLMAVQTRDENGRAVDVIPATPDADAAYHTGLSLIDSLEILNTLVSKED